MSSHATIFCNNTLLVAAAHLRQMTSVVGNQSIIAVESATGLGYFIIIDAIGLGNIIIIWMQSPWRYCSENSTRFMAHKRRFWNVEKYVGETVCNQPSASRRLVSKLSNQVYAPQTKIQDGRTNCPERVFDALFNFSQPKSSTHALRKCFENTLRTVCSAFQNLRL